MKSYEGLRRGMATAILAVFAATVFPSTASSRTVSPGANQPARRRYPAWKFAVTDDSRASGGAAAKSDGVATVALGAIARDIAAQGVDFVLFPGDMIAGETNDTAALSSMLDTWIATMAPVYDAGIPVYVTRGNHEYNTGAKGAANPLDPSRQTYLEHFKALPRNGPGGEVGLTWSFVHKNAKVVGFDPYANRTASYDNGLYAQGSNSGQAMNRWVLDEINGSASPLNFVIAHEQIFPTKSHPDCLANDPDSRDALVHALGTHNGTFLAGHDHMYVRGYMTDDQGERVPAFTVGTAGGGNYDYTPFDAAAAGYAGPDRYTVQKTVASAANPTFGYLLVTVNPDGTWSAAFRGFRFTHWNDPSDVSLMPISVWDTFTSSSMQGRLRKATRGRRARPGSAGASPRRT